MKVIDNFLSKQEYNSLYNKIFSDNFPWIYSPGVSVVPDNHFFFCHLFFHENRIRGQYFEELNPLLQKLNSTALVRVKANAYTQTSEIVKHDFHRDFNFPCKGFLYYLNDNNGYTEFIDGRIVRSVANRALFFDSFIPHRSTTCTDEKLRVNINVNYYSAENEIS